ncbi:MAG TPA: hypothetical protein VFQ24_15565 [Terriglobia bacterium]|nr:hypothetical protein [Terriglobia bacterium]
MSTDAYDGLKAVQVQLSRLFGSVSKEASIRKRTTAQWRRSFKAVLREIDRYVAANVDTDEIHRLMLSSGLAAAAESLKQEDFWPGYVEGITRLALTLLGDYPDHRRRKPGRKPEGYYRLNLARSVLWVQTPEQRFRTLIDAGSFGYPELSARPLDLLREFRRRFGAKPDHKDFLEWYRANFPQDYVAIFR